MVGERKKLMVFLVTLDWLKEVLENQPADQSVTKQTSSQQDGYRQADAYRKHPEYLLGKLGVPKGQLANSVGKSLEVASKE